MRFLRLVILYVFFLIFSSIETKAQPIKKVTDKSFYSDDVLFGKLSKPAQDTIITKAKEGNELNEVVVKSQASLIKYGPNGNSIVNVSGTVLASSSSVSELLGRVPNVAITEGEISVLGKGEAIIYLNGVLINYERFAAIPVSQIEKIEVIANPSSRYDAEGKAVINIVTKQNIESGIMGTAHQHITVSNFGGTSYNSLLDFSYSKGKFSFITNYGLQLGSNRELLYTTRTRPDPYEYLKSELTTDWKRRFNNYSNFGFGLQYNFSSKDYISLAYSGNVNDLGGITESRNAIANNSGNSFYATDVDRSDVLLNQFINLNYNWTTVKGSTLFIGAQFSNYNQQIGDFIEEKGEVNETPSERYLKNDLGSRINIMTLQTDYSNKISEKTKLEIGAKYSFATIKSGTDFLISNEENGNYDLNEDLSSDFEYNERIIAAYFNYGNSLSEKVNFSIGARAEKTKYNLYTNANEIQKFDKSYSNFFPNLLLNFNFSENWKGHFSYVSRITRPRYQALNPYVIYQDPFTTIEGNPNLVPEKAHAFEIGTMYKKFDFKIGYTYRINPISGAALRGDTPNSYVLKAINLESGHVFFSSLSRSFNIKWWNSTNTISMNITKQVDNNYSYVFSPVKPQFYFYSNNTFTVQELFKLQLLAWYLGDRSYGLGTDNSRSTVTVGIEKSFLKEALKINFSANDIFHKFMVSGDYNVGQTQIYYHRTYTSNYFKLIATYNFGNSKKTTYKKSEVEQSENSRAR
ncbi:outer membrane beta-barrel family protein [Flavobacterium foetidum]|uniref:outer membrane beta-barrel family protein n=1 Tax=Flavobacterium foetidum TaxID=2026681 RepID=UPI001075387C|nr:outer membrane beta-barrel family protein [Flavobacterium foetidum]KAF2509868.1 TonB-dependent receptor [Flavobacterium foetidum]